MTMRSPRWNTDECWALAAWTVLLFLLMAWALSGCAPRPSPVNTGSALAGGVDATIDSAIVLVEREQPKPVVMPILRAAKDKAVALLTSLDHIGQELRIANERTAVAETELKAERRYWIGYRARIACKWIIGIWLALGIASAVAGGFGAWGIVGKIARMVLNALPFGNPFTWLARKINAGRI